MKKLLIYILILTSNFCFGQNLITNGNFDTYTTCPLGGNLLSNASPWLNLALLSPDFLHKCSYAYSSSVPTNYYGYQIPHNGNGYAGIYASQTGAGPNVREYISIQLGQTLQSGNTYYLQFYVSLSNTSNYGVTTIGAYFSDSVTLPMNGYIIDVTPQIVNSTQALIDTADWEVISGTYTALGGEKYLTIGNFEDDLNSGIQQVGGPYNRSYYYIDNVSVSIDSISWLTAPTEINEINEISIYPNPTTGLVTIKAEEVKNIEVINIKGKQVYTGTETQINLSSQPKGMYIIKVITNKQSITRKLMKE